MIFDRMIESFVPNSMITEELSGLYGSDVLNELAEINMLYDIYKNGREFPTESNGDYIPSDMRYKKIKTLIDKEARFMFSKCPDFTIKAKNTKDSGSVSELQSFINEVIQKNDLEMKLVRAARDCFIGKRVALVCDVLDNGEISLRFSPAQEFVYENDAYGRLTKIVFFYNMNNCSTKKEQRIYKKRYRLENGECLVCEAVYDGCGELVKEIIKERSSGLTYIPASVILNDGLTGDDKGESDVEVLADYERWYSRLSAADMDSERQGMNPVRYAIDVNPETTKDLSLAAGAFWDLATDSSVKDSAVGKVGVLESSMSYSSALTITLDRLRDSMYEQLDIPCVSSEAMKGMITSGKTLKAVYWGLIVRCDEKFLSWRPALEFMVKCIIDGAKMFPNVVRFYGEKPLPDIPYIVRVDNNYPLPEDEAEEKELDLAEVGAKARSLKSYMKKWHNYTDEEADAELRQLAIERQILEDSYDVPPLE
ncbi:MAG: phage portal protein [Huintestinicola sp.]